MKALAGEAAVIGTSVRFHGQCSKNVLNILFSCGIFELLASVYPDDWFINLALFPLIGTPDD